MGTVFEPISPVPPIMTIFIPNLLVGSPASLCLRAPHADHGL
jgi:hypothetical protein